MKQLLITIAAVVLVGCGESQQSTSPEEKPIERGEGAKARLITINNAVMLKQIAAVKQHIAAGTDVNAKLRGRDTPLHIAVRHTDPSDLEDMMFQDEDADGVSDLAEMLLGTDENDPNSKPTNEEALKAENEWEHEKSNKELSKEIIELLIAKGADVNAKRDDGETPLHQAASKGRKEIIELLITNGADVSAKSDDGWTPLHQAAYEGHKEIAELLIDKGADVNAMSDIGRTPLYWAADSGYKEIIELLIAKGADVNAKTNDEKTLLDMANNPNKRNKNKKFIADLLRKNGAKTGEELKAEGK